MIEGVHQLLQLLQLLQVGNVEVLRTGCEKGDEEGEDRRR
jgi:hypothetical protein